VALKVANHKAVRKDPVLYGSHIISDVSTANGEQGAFRNEVALLDNL
jgi:hypothetical protein